ncbi:fused (3R)-hydroxyacyl-ACP dehydratase subunits HadA/HadB [Nocardia sp. NPDC046763]|uniref:fused (3R)-hydroxyacyl-ACP dehydratase subunits HadA/HadB n=1 Tax=Nocardia sp. NPDC046763 TaxID=3155256 RepID=UPI0033CC0DAF
MTHEDVMRTPALGQVYRARDHYEVGREKIREFARAVQDFHPAHWDDATAGTLGYPGTIAPITFASATISAAQRELLRTALAGYDPARLVQVEQEIHCHRPVVAGDRLTHEITVDSWRTVGGGDIIALTTVIGDLGTGPVQTVHTTLAGRGGTEGQRLSAIAKNIALQELPTPQPEPPHTSTRNRSFPARSASGLSRNTPAGHRFPSRTFRLTRGELINYAGVCGDLNPIHWSDDIARATSAPGVLTHGMLTMGLGGAALTVWIGHPTAILDYSTVFANPVHVTTGRAAEIEFTGTVTAVDLDASRATVALVAHWDGTSILGRAAATVALID